MTPTCLACKRRLRPQTKVPRVPKDWQPSDGDFNYREYAAQQKVKRDAQIEAGKLGYLGERQFCCQSCASFFGRVAGSLISPDQRASITNELQRYTWIKNRQKERPVE